MLLVCGLAMRANSFYGAPARPTLVDALVDEGYDVWVENWRTSIDLPAEDYTLDGAAVYDHPAAIRKIRSETGVERLSAVAHCMGSASLAMSVVAGLANELHTVVSSAVSLDVDLDSRSKRRLATVLPFSSLLLRMRGADPQWAARAPTVKAASLARVAQLAIRDYPNPLNAAATFIYGSRADGMWQLDQLDSETLDWLGREFGYSPFTFFRQIRRSAKVGRLAGRRPAGTAGRRGRGRSAERRSLHIHRGQAEPVLPAHGAADLRAVRSAAAGATPLGSARGLQPPGRAHRAALVPRRVPSHPRRPVGRSEWPSLTVRRSRPSRSSPRCGESGRGGCG